MSDNAPAIDRVTLSPTALLGPQKGELLAAADLGYFRGYWSRWIAEEVAQESIEAIIRQAEEDVADRRELMRRLERSSELVNLYWDYCSKVLTLVEPADADLANLTWPGEEADRRTMATALAAGAPGILVTEGGASFPVGEARNDISVLHSTAFLDILYQTHPDARERVAEYLARNRGLSAGTRRGARIELFPPPKARRRGRGGRGAREGE